MNKLLARHETRADYKARFTTSEFMAMADAGAFPDMRIELVQGELERMNPPMSEHAFGQGDVIWRLGAAVSGLDDRHVCGEVGIDLGDDTVRACDAAVVNRRPSGRCLLRPQDLLLVVEIADESVDRDLGPKRFDYAKAGVAYYWVVDVGARSVTVMSEPGAGDYASRHIVRFGEPLAVPGTDRTITL